MSFVECGTRRCSRRNLLAFFSFLLLCSTGFAQDKPPDAEGCKDSPLLSRFSGSYISSCEHKDFDAVTIPVFKDAEGNTKEQSVEGEVYRYDYGFSPDTSELQIYRNVLNALRAAAYTVDFEESPYKLTVHRGAQYLNAEIGGGAYTLYTIKQKAMEQTITATAAEMQSEIEKSGHVAVYGVEFEMGKAELLSASEAVLKEVLKLLNDNPSLRIRVEGHTDSVGARDLNQKLSEQRARAVVNWLTANGIDKSRLTAQGFADTKPVADNSADEGRAKNRRVELVKL